DRWIERDRSTAEENADVELGEARESALAAVVDARDAALGADVFVEAPVAVVRVLQKAAEVLERGRGAAAVRKQSDRRRETKGQEGYAKTHGSSVNDDLGG